LPIQFFIHTNCRKKKDNWTASTRT
jgi:hypothetical protein